MISALYYPKNFECKTREGLVKNKEVHKRFTDAMPYSVIDNEDDDYNHYWYKNNFGKLIIDKIIQAGFRAYNKFGGTDIHQGNIGFFAQKPDQLFYYDM